MIFDSKGPHSQWTTPLDEKVTASWKRTEKHFARRRLAIEGYEHLLFFPTLTIATSFGASFSIQTFEPVSAAETRFVSRVFLARLDDDDESKPSAWRRAFADSVVAFNRQVFDEDRVICEQVQKGMSQGRGLFVLSDLEARVGAFQRAVAATVEAAK